MTSSTLPPGYLLVADLTPGGAPHRVVRALRGETDVILRLDPGLGLEERLAELAVLGAVSHPGLARLLDHGTLPGGKGAYVARSWVEGRELGAWAEGIELEDVGRIAARLCPALEHLHRRGFVHGDLKAANVIVSDAGEPVLTDFGLARRSGEASQAVSGTLFAIAPEVLFGRAPDARSDLFALGVLLHEFLVRRRAPAREFYGRFPAEDFFAATGTAPSELPAWARDLVTSLLERDPDRRPRSAEEVGRVLAGRLGIEGLFREAAPTLPWRVRTGRAGWAEARVADLLRSSEEIHLGWFQLPPGEEPAPLTDDLALLAALRGGAVVSLDLASELFRARNGVELDAWARSICGEGAGALLFASVAPGDAWARRAVDALARTSIQLREGDGEGPLGLVVGATGAPAPAGLGWRLSEVPGIGPDEVLEFLREHLEDAGDERLAGLAERLAEESGGSATALDELLRACSREGWFLAGDEQPRLRPGSLSTPSASSGRAVEPLRLERAPARLLASLHVLGGAASIEDLRELGELGDEELAAALATLVSAGHAAPLTGPDGAGLTLRRASSSPIESVVPEETWGALHRRRAKQLSRAGAPEERRLPHEVRAGVRGPEPVVAASRRLRDSGLAELALELADRVALQAREAGRELEAEIQAERALAWCALGQADRALAEIEPLARSVSGECPGIRALLERVRGQVAATRHEPGSALEHFERALELDPEDGGQAALGKGHLLYELGRDGELLELVSALRAGGDPPPALEGRVWANLRSIEAMSFYRTGELDRARSALGEQVDEARMAGDHGREAGLRINLGTLERRAGDPREAERHLELAAAHYDRSGQLPGLAQARAMLGGLLRDSGELMRAGALFASALAIRERLGDRVGAAAVRGMSGLLLADRGHARAAIEELEKSAELLREVGRSRDAALLAVRSREMEARLGSSVSGPRPEAESERLDEGDPRALVSFARAAWLSGDREAARDFTRRAADLGQSLGLVGLREETAFLERRLAGEAAAPESEVGSSLVGEDERLFALLSSRTLGEEEAERTAGRLAERGRDDRAARLLFALGARLTDEDRARELARRGEALFATCARGLTPEEAAALRAALLGFPDPWPEDLPAAAHRSSTDEEFEMEVTKLLEINHRLVTQEDEGSLLGTIVEQALSVSGAQRGFLVLEEEGELAVDTAMDSRRGGIEPPDVEISGSVLRRALKEMQPVRISNAVDDPLLGSAPSVTKLELRSILCAPFRVQTGLRGVIYVDHRLREAAFDQRVEKLLALLADQAALAIRQVRRVKQIRDLNRELKRRVDRQETDLRTARERLRVAGLPAPAGGLVGDSAIMREVHHLVERAASSDLAVIVSGESGTGKELAARALHDLGPRVSGPFVSENCAAIPASLIEAELFGARRGAYTGADRDREGLFERAHGGTLFLDEIGELPLELQAKLLRVLETGEVRRLGDTHPRAVDFRLVAATNRELGTEVQEGRFRADLFYRLDGLRIEMPPLRAHAEDIPDLVDHILRRSTPAGEAPRTISRAVVARLGRRDWPGNVRELFNEVSRLLVLCEGDVDDPELVRAPQLDIAPSTGGRVRTLAELEREAIEHALRTSGNDKRRAAELLGISRAKIYQRIKEWSADESGAGSASPRPPSA